MICICQGNSDKVLTYLKELKLNKFLKKGAKNFIDFMSRFKREKKVFNYLDSKKLFALKEGDWLEIHLGKNIIVEYDEMLRAFLLNFSNYKITEVYRVNKLNELCKRITEIFRKVYPRIKL